MIQVNFFNGYFKSDRNKGILHYTIKDDSGDYKLDFYEVYDIYLSIYKGKCYNLDNEMEAMLSFFSVESYEELRKIANGNKEALEIVKDLEDLAMEAKFVDVYDKMIFRKNYQLKK